VRLSGGAAPYSIGYLAFVVALAGDREKAQRLMAPLLTAPATQYVSPLPPALFYFGLGNLDQAFHWFNRSCDDQDIFSLLHIRYDPLLAPLRSDPRMAALYARINRR
jgi:hypothetical protein